MARKRYSDEDALEILREIDVPLHDGLNVVNACGKAGISDKNYCYWRKKFGGMGRPQLSEMRALQKENERLKKNEPLSDIGPRAMGECRDAEMQLNELILKESLDHLKPMA
ncbi:MAG: transposase-like protein [Halocynthiibacter sp.]|jgi:putative transposase